MNSKKVTKTEKVVNISSRADFGEWRKGLRAFRSYEGTSIIFNLSELTEPENQNLNNLVKEYNNACGCQSGSFLMSITFFATIAWFFLSGGEFNAVGYKEILSLLGITLLAALFGKLLGLLAARWKLIKLADQLQEKFSKVYLDNISTNL